MTPLNREFQVHRESQTPSASLRGQRKNNTALRGTSATTNTAKANPAKANPAKTARPRVVIVGAGFGGLALTKKLRKAPVDVVLIDKNNYHTFQPLLYQVATAALEAEEIAGTVRGILRRQKNFAFRLGNVIDVDWRRQAVILEDGDSIDFDFLVLAAGATTNTFGVEGVGEYAFELKSLEDAVRLRNHVIRQFETASADESAIDRGVLNFVVVGGGPTGVETSGALRELFTHVLRKDFPNIDIARTRVVLLEASEHLLSPFASRLRTYAADALRRLGVDVDLGQSVERVSADGVVYVNADGATSVLPTHTVVWSAGVRANQLADTLAVEQTRGGRIAVRPDLTVPGHGNVFAIGDIAGSTAADGALDPQLAPVAIQGAAYVADAIMNQIAGKPSSRPFVYTDKGIMATIGRGAAVAELPSGFKLRGWLAWHAWALLHLTQIVGLRNKIYVYANWVYNYVTYDRSARLLLEVTADHPQSRPPEIPSPAAHEIARK